MVVVTASLDQIREALRTEIRSELASYFPPKENNSDLPALFTRKQAAAHLQVSMSTLHNWGQDRDNRGAILVPTKINSQIRYRREDVLNALKQVRRYRSSK